MSLHLTLYSKPGCHLCEEMRALLDDMQPEFGLMVEEIDITADETLFARYRHAIPVLRMDGREIARGRMSEPDLLKVLQGRRRKAKDQK